jgi:hypothetical protein
MSRSDATETLKWTALVLMTGDHLNKHLLGGSVAGLFAAGRLAFPLFVGVLAFNLSRPGCDAGARVRVMNRLALAGVVASLPYTALGWDDLAGHWWPANVLFTLLLVTLVVHGIEMRSGRGTLLAGAALLVGGALVEFWWPGVMLGVALWRWFRHRRWSAAALVVLATAGLCGINGNAWALAALAVAALAACLPAPPRCGRFFYTYYPAHLGVLLGLRWALA